MWAYLFEKSLLFMLGHVGGVPFGEPGASVAADQEEAMNHFRFIVQGLKL